MSKLARRAREQRDEEIEVERPAPDAGFGAVAEDLRRLSTEELAGEVAADWQAPVAVAGNAKAEADADALAEAAVSRMPAGAAALTGDRLSPQLEQAMAMAAPDVAGLADVRFDRGSVAAGTADALGARAFAHGNEVSLGRGALGTGDATHLVAHEAAHAVQQQAETSAEGTPLVHAKMRGTKDALTAVGGGSTTKGLRKKIGAKTNWDRIVEGVGAYEEMEAGLLKGGKNPTDLELNMVKPQMLKVLTRIQSDIKAWQKANDHEGSEKKKEKALEKYRTDFEQLEGDDRTKAERRQVIAMLAPRIGNEISLLQSEGSKGWLDSLGLAPSKGKSTGKEGSGQMNTVSELTYATENGEFSGYFKAEKGFDSHMAGHDLDTGITQHDPNYGARAVAMYKLDKLFGAGVTARAEFATHVDKSGKLQMGTVLESAKGVQASDAKVGVDKGQAQQMGPGAFSLDDPVFQRSLNKLQIFDAICGQLDRHLGNFYVQVDESGMVTGVTGIDLDMAFGKDMQSHDDKTSKAAQNYHGLPAQIDAEFGRAILKVNAADIESCLKGLLSPAEVAATVARFESVKKVVAKLNGEGKLQESWDFETAFSGVQEAKNLKFGYAKDSYKANMASQSVIATRLQLCDIVAEALAGHGPSPFRNGLTKQLQELPDLTRQLFQRGFVGDEDSGVPRMVARWAFDSRNGEQAVQVAMLVMNEILADSALMSSLIVKAQEESGISATAFVTPITEAVSKYIPIAAAKLPKRKG